jgi:glutamyl-tRNA(Gln) amidotransferase subunit E
VRSILQLSLSIRKAEQSFTRGITTPRVWSRQTGAIKATGLNEEPPHDLNREALEIALMAALMTGTLPVNETHVMRKVVIDGSTPHGFQRTAVVALDGEIVVGDKKVPIQTVCLEEDASRNTGEEKVTVFYRLDRLGAPLIEVVTGPVITSPKEAEEVASALGRILRATRRMKRGIGTIRQDLNISIKGGALSEVKGVQELELISKVVKFEVQRQLTLLEIRDKLKERGLKEEDLYDDIHDVTEVFRESESHIIESALKQGAKVMAVTLPKLAGILKLELMPGVRFGTEVSDYAKFWGGAEGIFHTDELPAFGITEKEINFLRSSLKTNEEDAIAFVAAKEEDAIEALKAVIERVKIATKEVPNETRSAYPDGTTHFSRPRPGAARMYPETDVHPVSITDELLKEIQRKLPELPEAKLSRLMKEYGLNKKLADQVLNSDYCNIFEAVSSQTRLKSSFVAATLTETFKDMVRKGIDVTRLPGIVVEGMFKLVDVDVVAKEAIPEILTWLVEHEGAGLEDAVESLGLKMASDEELAAIMERVIRENEIIIKRRGSNALGALMGEVMKEMRGKVDAKRISRLLKMRIEEIIAK